MTALGTERSTPTTTPTITPTTRPATAPNGAWAAGTLAVLGDSTSVGIGDPLPGGRWRGIGPLLADALGAVPHNVAVTGARMADVRAEQLPAALAARPDAAVVIVGMNDTLRSDFDPEEMRVDLTHVVAELQRVGTVVVLARYHDHARVFRLPTSLRRALRTRIERLNVMIDAVVAATGAPYLDLDGLPGAYETTAWSVDRLHPSELGHRLLAKGFAEVLAARGCVVRNPVSLACEGGLQASPAAHVAWLVIKGIPWLWRRGRDLVPYAVGIMWRGYADPVAAPVSPSGSPSLPGPVLACGQLEAEAGLRP